MLIRVGLTQRSSEKKMSMTPTLFLAGVILPAKIFFIQHVHTVLIAIRSKNSNGFGNNCINQVFFHYEKIVHGAKHMYSRAAIANFWQTRPPQWRPHQLRATTGVAALGPFQPWQPC